MTSQPNAHATSPPWEIRLHCKNKKNSILTFLLDTNDRLQLSLDFAEKNGNLVIWQYFDDPDYWRLVKYPR